MTFRLLATRRRKLLFVLAVLLVLVMGPYLFSRVMSPYRQLQVRQNTAATAATTQPDTLRLLTYNIAHGRGATTFDNWEGTAEEKQARVAEIAELLLEADADIVVLNEVDFSATWSGHQNQAEALALAAGYPYWVEQRNLDFRFLHGSWKFGNAILSRYPIVATELLELPARATWEHVLAGSKQGVIATVELPSGEQMRIAAIHLEHRGEAIRVESARALLAANEAIELPFLAAGDFNSTPSGFPLSRQNEAGENALDVLLAADAFTTRPLTEPTAEELTFRSYEPINLIDWIFIPTGWEFATYTVLDTQLSDHRPVMAEIVLPAEQP